MAFKIILTILSIKILQAKDNKFKFKETVKDDEFFGVMMSGYNHDKVVLNTKRKDLSGFTINKNIAK
jgi:hypothetical protein